MFSKIFYIELDLYEFVSCLMTKKNKKKHKNPYQNIKLYCKKTPKSIPLLQKRHPNLCKKS